jgi:uncharacterized membrane protein
MLGTVPLTVWIYRSPGPAPVASTAPSETETDRNRDRKEAELTKRIQQLEQMVELRRQSAEVRDAQIDAQVKDGQQKYAALAKDVAVVKADVSVVKTKVESAPAEFAKALMAQGRDLPLSLAPTPNKTMLPSPIEAPTAGSNKDGEKVSCSQLFNDFLLCRPYLTPQQ